MNKVWRGVVAVGACFGIALTLPPLGWSRDEVLAAVSLGVTCWVLWLLWGRAARRIGVNCGGTLWRLGLFTWLMQLGD